VALPAVIESKLSGLLAAERALVENEERAAFDAASRSAAIAGRKLYEVHVANAAKRRAESPVDANRLADLMRSLSQVTTTPSVVLSEADRRTLLGATAEIGAGIANDAGAVVLDTARAAGNVGRLLLWVTPLLPYLLVAYALWHFRAALRKALA
jgi:hypothetical protein